MDFGHRHNLPLYLIGRLTGALQFNWTPHIRFGWWLPDPDIRPNAIQKYMKATSLGVRSGKIVEVKLRRNFGPSPKERHSYIEILIPMVREGEPLILHPNRAITVTRTKREEADEVLSIKPTPDFKGDLARHPGRRRKPEALPMKTAHKIRCFDSNCKGTPFAVNTAGSRLAAYFGRTHYKCDGCGAEWSVDVQWYAKSLAPVR